MSTLSRTRPSVGGLNGAVASAHPLASQAGLETLRTGGNAIDAIVATAATLNVVEPYMSGIGGVGFLLFHPAGGDTRVLNFSGYAPRAATADQLTPEDQDIGPKACLVPCNLGGWLEALQAHGTQPADQVFSRAIELAERGFPLHPVNARMIEATLPRLNEAG
ncbi:MAG TPA: gamma-glutamyltransferase, partial [Planctomycetaceae bacterium]|nr:gamma-glutamyltransferase [Planctomycetaceae bacterium]